MNLKDLQDLTKDDLLAKLGLQTKPTFMEELLPGLALFGAGMLLGAGLGLLLAPKAGSELRHELGDSAKRAMGQAKATVPSAN